MSRPSCGPSTPLCGPGGRSPAALVGTGLLLARGARSAHPSGADLRTAAAVNAAWATACLAMLPRRRENGWALALLTATAALDAAAGAAQWLLRPERDR